MANDGLITSFLGQGTAAARPAAPTIASTAIAFYWATDTDVLSLWRESAWATVGSGSGTVTTTGSPANGNLAKFSGASSIVNGDLSGDVTTSGTLAATIANDAVTYAKMQNASAGNVVLTRANSASGDYGETALSASNLLGRGSSGDIAAVTLGTGLSMSGAVLSASLPWALAGTGQTATGVYDFATDGAKANVEFVGLAGKVDILVITSGVTLAVSGVPRINVSDDNGSTFKTASGDYVRLASTGVATNVAEVVFGDTNATAARSGGIRIVGANVATGARLMESLNAASFPMSLYLASSNAITAVRISATNGGNITGGKIYCFAR